VRRGDGACAAPRQLLQDRRRQRAALGGVRAAADLVDQRQARVVRLLQDLPQVPEVGGEGGETRLDRLLVANVGEDVTEYR
jgi:hypothetical protein